eukprot:TRINITY_DN5097_c0_g1_i1.p1 TRINITY_DN5097_c0_g1~~TRINITY_DN5097_c0_g1_i1.p1  ORF type:complete len:252 (-),score=36.97 TRINITY_DN5097_c0_g1_i1:62-817(-)
MRNLWAILLLCILFGTLCQANKCSSEIEKIFDKEGMIADEFVQSKPDVMLYAMRDLQKTLDSILIDCQSSFSIIFSNRGKDSKILECGINFFDMRIKVVFIMAFLEEKYPKSVVKVALYELGRLMHNQILSCSAGYLEYVLSYNLTAETKNEAKSIVKNEVIPLHQALFVSKTTKPLVSKLINRLRQFGHKYVKASHGSNDKQPKTTKNCLVYLEKVLFLVSEYIGEKEGNFQQAKLDKILSDLNLSLIHI